MFNMMSEAGKQAAVRCWSSNTCLMIPGNNLGLFQRSLRGSSWNIILVNFYSMHLIIVTTTIQGQDAFTLYLIYSLPYPSEVCVMTFILWRRTGLLKLIINDSNDYLCSLSTITVPRLFICDLTEFSHPPSEEGSAMIPRLTAEISND